MPIFRFVVTIVGRSCYNISCTLVKTKNQNFFKI